MNTAVLGGIGVDQRSYLIFYKIIDWRLDDHCSIPLLDKKNAQRPFFRKVKNENDIRPFFFSNNITLLLKFFGIYGIDSYHYSTVSTW